MLRRLEIAMRACTRAREVCRVQSGWVAHCHGSEDKTARVWDARIGTMSTKELIAEACLRLRGLTRLSRDEMRLVGYAEDASEIDACAGVE